MILTNVVRPVRRQLIAMAAAGRAKFRVFGSGKNWVVVVETPSRKVQVFPTVFSKMKAAQNHVGEKFGLPAPQLKTPVVAKKTKNMVDIMAGEVHEVHAA